MQLVIVLTVKKVLSFYKLERYDKKRWTYFMTLYKTCQASKVLR